MTIVLVAVDAAFTALPNVLNLTLYKYKNQASEKTMFKYLVMIAAVCSFSCCTMSPTSSLDDPQKLADAGVKLKAQDAVLQCLTPHEAFGIPPQAVPGIPVLVVRHAECLGQPNIIVAIWPESMNRVNLLYVEMMIQRYAMHLKEAGEHYDAVLHDVSQVKLDPNEKEDQKVPAFAAVYKLVHKSPDAQK